MIELLRKDFRLYRPVFIAAAILMTGAYVVPFLIGMILLLNIFWWYALIAQGLTICLLIAFLQKHIGIYRAASLAALSVFLVYLAPMIIALLISSIGSRFDFDSRGLFKDWAMTVQALTILLAAAFGGCAFAIERRDRSAEFLAMMPVPRAHIVASKIALAAAAIFPLWIIHSTLVYITSNGAIDPPTTYEQSRMHEAMLFQAYILPGALILLAFGVSWFFSTLTKSPSVSACLGLAAMLCFVVARNQMVIARDPDWPNIDVLIAACAVPIGSLFFIAGTIIFTQRVSP
jgi:ABC-2 family transporter protein